MTQSLEEELKPVTNADDTVMFVNDLGSCIWRFQNTHGQRIAEPLLMTELEQMQDSLQIGKICMYLVTVQCCC